MNNKLISLILISFIISCGIAQTSKASTLESVTIDPDEIFKCQPSIITATFSDYAGITDVVLLINNSRPFRMNHGKFVYSNEAISMSYTNGVASYYYGNDPTTIDGYKSVAFAVTDTGVITIYNSGQHLNVYSDTCTGTNIEGYKNVSNGIPLAYLGNWTTDDDIYTSLARPYGDVIGFGIFYFLFIMAITIMVYIKSRNPLTTGTVGLLLFTLLLGTEYIPEEYKMLVMFLLAAVIVYLLKLVFLKRD